MESFLADENIPPAVIDYLSNAKTFHVINSQAASSRAFKSSANPFSLI